MAKTRKPNWKWIKIANAYKKRNAVLREMGYASYKAYLASDLWKRIRERILSRDDHRCRVCNATATEVHHQKYTRIVLEGGYLLALYSLCRRCHENIEFKGGEKVKKLHKVAGRLNGMLNSRYAAKQRKASP